MIVIVHAVQCASVCHSYDGARNAVDNVSFCVRAGEVLALVGPNGAGKSTALRMLATLQQPGKGHVLWDGEDTWPARHQVRRKIGFLGDGQALYADMQAQRYLAFFGECYGLSAAQARTRADTLLEVFDLSGKAHALVSDLSKGMRQRLAIARTLVHEPELLLLDEPADGLDPLGRRRLRDLLRETAARGVGIVVSSHILRELDGFAHTVAVMQKGRLQVCGSVEDVIARFDVNRRLHELRIVKGFGYALSFLQQREGLIEHHEAKDNDGGIVRVRVHGEDDQAAALLSELVAAGVAISSFAKVRTDLEDVYQSLGSDEVS